jgi:hypothetical protein
MAQTYHIKDWFPDAALNNGASPLGAKEKMDRDQVNDVMREMMGAVSADWLGDSAAGGPWRSPTQDKVVSSGGTNQVVIADLDASSHFPINRKVKVVHATGNPVYGFVSAVSFATNTTVTVEDFDDTTPDHEVRGDAIGIFFYSAFGSIAGHELGRGAFKDASIAFVEPASLDDTGVNAAIATANTDGKIVLLRAGTYAIDNPINVPTGTRIWGRGGLKTIIRLNNTRNQSIFAIADNATDVEIRDMQLDGNASNQSAAGIGIQGASGNQRIDIRGLYIHDTYGSGIEFNSVVADYFDIRIENCVVDTCGQYCILISNPSSSGEGVFLRNLVLREPGTGGAATALTAAIRTQASTQIDGLLVELNSTATYGIDISSTSDVIVTNFIMRGMNNSSSRYLKTNLAGTFIFSTGSMSASSLGRSFEFNGAGVHKLSNVDIAGVGCQGEVVNGDNTEITKCSFDSALAAVTLNSTTGATIDSCRFTTNSYIEMELVSTLNLVKNCTFDGASTNAIKIKTGCTENFMHGNVFTNSGADCVVCDAGSSDNSMLGSFHHATVGSLLVDNGDRNCTGEVVFIPTVAQDNLTAATETILTGMGDVNYPIPTDGSRRFLVELSVAFDVNTSSNDLSISFHSGTAGNLTDAVLNLNYVTGTGVANITCDSGVFTVTPAAGHTFTVGVIISDGNISDIDPNGFKTASILNNISHSYVKVTYLDG